MLIVHDFVLDPVTGFVMLHGEPLQNRSHHDLRDAAIFSGIDISDAKSALDIERIITAYFMRRLYNRKQLADVLSKTEPDEIGKILSHKMQRSPHLFTTTAGLCINHHTHTTSSGRPPRAGTNTTPCVPAACTRQEPCTH